MIKMYDVDLAYAIDTVKDARQLYGQWVDSYDDSFVNHAG